MSASIVTVYAEDCKPYDHETPDLPIPKTWLRSVRLRELTSLTDRGAELANLPIDYSDSRAMAERLGQFRAVAEMTQERFRDLLSTFDQRQHQESTTADPFAEEDDPQYRRSRTGHYADEREADL